MIDRVALLLLVSACTVLSSCGDSSTVVLTNHRTPAGERLPDSVKITTEWLPTPPFLELGYVYAQQSTLDATVSEAKKRAASIGGTVIMNARVGATISQVSTFLIFPLYDRSYFVRGIVAREKRLR